MNNILSLKKVVLGAGLALAPALASAQALSQLGVLAGVDVKPLAQQLQASRALAVRPADVPPATIPMNAKDVLSDCGVLDAKPIMPWTAKQAALLVQTCLNHAYAADGAFRVTAEAARFGVRACPKAAPGTLSCEAIIEVEGLKLTVSGQVLTGNSVLLDLNYSLDKRGGLLLGFHAIVDDQATIGR